MSTQLLGPLLLLLAFAISIVWVARDANARHDRGDPVVARVGPLTLDQPAHWLIACVLLWILACPLYLVARQATSR